MNEKETIYTLDDKLTEKIIGEVWGKCCSIPIIALISAIVGVPMCCTIYVQLSYSIIEDNKTYSVPSKMATILVAIIILCFIGLNIWNILFVYSRNHIRKAKRKKAGIMIYLDTNSSEIYKSTIRKFGDEFKNNLFSGFDVIYIPFGKKVIEYRNEKMVSFLRRKRCLLFFNIRINTDKDGDSVIYDMRINGTIIHLKYKDSVKKKFERDFSATLSKFENIVFPSKEMIKKLRVTATEMSIGCEYVIGLSLFLNGEFESAEKVLSMLVEKVSKTDQWKTMNVSINRIRYEMFMTIATVYMEKYQRQCDDEASLDKMNEFLEKAGNCYGYTYDYYLTKAYYSIAKYRDANRANEYINLCKQMKKVPQIWKYSEAFLKAYENKSLGSICSSYKSALLVPYNILDLIVYIEAIIEKEPERSGLLLALGILYRNVGNETLANDYLKKYIQSVPEPLKAKEMLIKKKIYQGTNVA